VRADQLRFTQVMLNLLSNAIKYNYEGGTVVVTCEMRAVPPDLDQGGNVGRPSGSHYVPSKGENQKASMLRFAVRDMGPGIPPDKLARLFTPFDRLDADQTEVPGTGLGLALSKQLVEAMGGTIGVESAVGQGSTFWVELPLAEVP
jgi:signal transduction histidine kinase